MIALLSLAWGQSFTTQLIEAGNATTVPVAVAVRQWPSDDQVFFAVETREISGSDKEHVLEIQEWTCGNASCSTVSLTDGPDAMGGALRGDPFMNPSMGIHRESSNDPIELLIHRRSVTEDDCDDDDDDYDEETDPGDENIENLAMRRWSWDTSSGAGAYPVIVKSDPGDGVCEDAGLSYTRVLTPDHEPHAVFRWLEDTVTPGKDQVEAAIDTTSTTIPNTPPGGGSPILQDHAQFDFYDGDLRVVAHRSKETISGNLRSVIRVRFLDEGSPEPDIRFVGDYESDYPSIVYDDDRFHLVWHDKNSGNSNAQIWYATCERAGAVDCLDVGDWDTELVDTGTDMVHANVEVDGDKVFIVYMDDEDSNAMDKDYRVRVKTQCYGAAAWSGVSEVTPFTATNSEWAQSLFMGRPNFALNRLDNVFHLGLIEMASYDPTTDDADAYWVRATYSDCP